MKELIFVRHAKSDWGTEFLKDVDRPLSERGYTDAYYMSDWYTVNKTAPELMITSSATRALNTALIFARSLEFDLKNFRIDEELFECAFITLLNQVKKQDNAFSKIMVFGHNPAITNICNELSEEMFFENVPTAGIVSLHFDIKKWDDLKLKTGTLDYYQFPKDFKTHK